MGPKAAKHASPPRVGRRLGPRGREHGNDRDRVAVVPIDQLLGLVARVEHEGLAVDEVADRDLAIGERLLTAMHVHVHVKGRGG